MILHGKQYSRYKAIKSHDTGAFVVIKWLGYIIGAFSLILIFLSLFTDNKPLYLGYGFVLLGASLAIMPYSLYLAYLKEYPFYNNQKSSNLVDRCDYPAIELLESLVKSNTWAEFFAKLSNQNKFSEEAFRTGLDSGKLAMVKDAVTEETISGLLSTIQADRITAQDIFKAIYRLDAFKETLKTANLTNDQLDLLLDSIKERHQLVDLHNHYWLEGKNTKTGGIAKDWAVSYTFFLDSVTEKVDGNIAYRNIFSPIYERSALVDEAISDLNKKSGQNILLIGPSGIGKKEIFYHIAEKIVNYETKTALDGEQVRILHIERFLANINTENVQAIVDRLFSDLINAGNAVLFIPQINLLLEPHQQTGTLNLAQVFQSFLANDKIRIIGTIEPELYQKYIQKDQLLDSHFSQIEIHEPTVVNNLKILLFHLSPIENHYDVAFLLPTLIELSRLTKQYLKDDASPLRELKVLEDVASFTHSQSRQLVQIDDIETVLERETHAVIKLEDNKKQTLLNLESLLHQKIIGQEKAIKAVADAMIRGYAGARDKNKPLGTFLMLGPTGVGKTETAKALSEIFFGSADRLIRLDMAEYSGADGVDKLLGRDLIDEPGALTLAMKESPSSVVLFDEFEKSSPKVQTIMLSVLDEGKLTTNYGKVVDFSNSIIIATSNAGSDLIKQAVEKGVDINNYKKQLVDSLISNRVFLPELLNRFDGIIMYSPLNQAEVGKIVVLQLDIIKQSLLKDKGIELIVAPAVVEQLAKEGYDPVFGARALQRVINDKLQTSIAKSILEQNLSSGAKLELNNL